MSPRRRLVRTGRSLLLAAGLALAVPRAAEATWSIIIVDTRTGEIAIGSATCLSGFDLQMNASIVVPGIGAAAAQSFVDQTGLNRVFLYDQMLLATPPDEIITRLAGFDSGHQTRQYGIVDLRDNGRAATFTGSGAGQYRGGRTGRVVGAGPTGGDLVYAVQGNVLTGAPVIDAAVAAIETEPGDVPEKLMRAMEEAMRLGGDGRCSCSPSNPTGCGSPPDQFTRSAYIAYMVVSRAGDRPGCNGLYRINATGPVAIVGVDLNQDSLPDLVTCNQASSSISVLLNTLGSGWATFGLPMQFPVGASPRDIVAADFDADGLSDVATANFNTDDVTVRFGAGNGTFLGRVDYPAGDGPLALATGDFDNDGDTDISVANQPGAGVTILLNNGEGAFSARPAITLPAGPGAIAAADLDADADVDLVLAVATSPVNSLVVLRNTTPDGGIVEFTAETPIDAGRNVNSVAIGDLNADSRPDVAVLAVSDSQVNVFLQGDAGFGAPTGYAFASQGTDMLIGDVDGDDVLDLIASTRATPQRFATFSGRGDGAFDPARTFALGATPGRIALTDLNLDGFPDLAGALPNNAQAITVRNFGDAEFNSGAGCASGEYWLNLNVANVPPTAPDPVPILRSQFDTLRGDYLGLTDAVRSAAAFMPPAVRADGVNTAELVITLRDWTGAPVSSAPVRSVQVLPGSGSSLGTTIGDARLEADGTYRAPVTSGLELGEARFLVLVEDGPGARPVLLMPEVGLALRHRADWDLSGAVDSSDFMAFLEDFFDADAEFNNDAVFNSQDFFDFLAAFFKP